MTENHIALSLVLPKDRPDFTIRLQRAFSSSLKEKFNLSQPFPPTEEIEAALQAKGKTAYYILYNGEKAGGAVLEINGETHRNFLEFFFIDPLYHGQGLGLEAWKEVEKLYPQTKVWELVTPYFEKRNIHFYTNKCGFKIVEFVNKHHISRDSRYRPQEGETALGQDEFFRFEKIMRP